MKDVVVNIFFRKKTEGFRSLEEIFDIVIKSLVKVKVKVMEVPEKRISPKNLWTNLRWVASQKGNINHITGDIHYAAIALGPNTVLTIHDANSILHGRFWKRFMIKLLWFWLPALVVNRITTVSEKSKAELLKIVPFAKKKIIVIPNPYNPKLLDRPHMINPAIITNTSKPIVLHLGTKSNKNLERTIVAMEGLPYKLYIIGKMSSEQADLISKHKVDFRSYFNLPYAEVSTLYHQCSMVSFASLYEGFGMPIIEAQLVGKPVLTSNLDPMPWVAGEGGAHFVDPYDKGDIRKGIVQIMENESYRDKLVENGLKNVQRFDPSMIAGKYEDVYKEMLAI